MYTLLICLLMPILAIVIFTILTFKRKVIIIKGKLVKDIGFSKRYYVHDNTTAYEVHNKELFNSLVSDVEYDVLLCGFQSNDLKMDQIICRAERRR